MSVKTAIETFIIAAAVGVANLLVAVFALFNIFAELFRSASKPVKNGKPTNVLITGGSNGIGRSLALRYARPGSLIALTGRNTERLNAVAAEVRALGAQVLTSTVDVADEQAMATFVLELDTKHPLDLVIANAGVHASTIGWKGLEENTRQLNAVNVQGVYNTVMPLIERFKQRKAGQLAVVASLGGFFDIPRAVSYAAGKSGLIVFCRGLRHALTPFGVRVNTICPGFIDTGFTAHLDKGAKGTPVLMSADKAAGIVVTGLQNDDAVIAFPLNTYLRVMVFHSLPPAILEFLLSRVPQQEWNRLG